MSEIKISEMVEAEKINKEDLIMIVQNGVNKKAHVSKIETNEGVSVVDGLESTSENEALSARQGNILNEKIIGTVLYENETGTTGNVTSSDDAENYDYIEIQGKRKIGNTEFLYSTGRLYKPNKKTVSISATYTDSANVYVYSKIITINGNNINVIRANLAVINNACTISSDDSNFITRVVGYKVL